MPERRERWFVLAVITGLVILTTVPYIVAVNYAGEEYVFGGFLLNPLDGNTYLAKMYQGWRGDVQYTLPYSAEEGRGTFMFIFYLILGHVARLSGFSLLLTFHVFRVFATVLMLITLFHFIGVFTPDQRTQRLAFILAAFGAGLGWLLLPFGVFTSDFWVAEAYPFLSAYANPHFPLSLALMLFLLTIKFERPSWVDKLRIGYKGLLIVLAAFLLAIVSPFGVVLVLLVLLTITLWESNLSLSGIKQSEYANRIVWVLLGGGPLLIYYLWVTNNDPLLRIWNTQNQTSSPPIWDLIISFSPILILTTFSMTMMFKKKIQPAKLLICWVLIGFSMLYIPWGLQRRFMMGLYIPLATLAAIWIAQNLLNRRGYKIWIGLLIILVIPTNIIVLLAARHGMQANDPAIYHTNGEAQAFQWIENHTASDALILSSPETGLLIPAHTGRRVLYGHPYETVNAEHKEAIVRNFFRSNFELIDLDSLKDVDYIFEGPRERQEGGIPQGLNLHKVYQKQDVIIYESIW